MFAELMDYFILTRKSQNKHLIKDHIWLTDDLTRYFEAKQRFSCSESFLESLFLNYRYVSNTSNMDAPFGDQLFEEYRLSSRCILQELIQRGVYILYGCEPTNIIRSCFDFIVLINDDIYPEFIEFLKTLYLCGVNVNSRRVKNGLVLQEMVFAKDAKKSIYTESYNNTIALPQGFHSHGRPEVSPFNYMYTHTVNPWFGIGGCLSYDLLSKCKEKTKCRHHSLYICETWSQNFDNTRVEDIVLCQWIHFNGKYGLFNIV